MVDVPAGENPPSASNALSEIGSTNGWELAIVAAPSNTNKPQLPQSQMVCSPTSPHILKFVTLIYLFIRVVVSTTYYWIACTKTVLLGEPWSCTAQATTQAMDTIRACKLHLISNNNHPTPSLCQAMSPLQQMCRWRWCPNKSRWWCSNNNSSIWWWWCRRGQWWHIIRTRLPNRWEAIPIHLAIPSIIHSRRHRRTGLIRVAVTIPCFNPELHSLLTFLNWYSSCLLWFIRQWCII